MLNAKTGGKKGELRAFCWPSVSIHARDGRITLIGRTTRLTHCGDVSGNPYGVRKWLEFFSAGEKPANVVWVRN